MLIAKMRDELQQIIEMHESAHDQCRAVVALLFRITVTEPEVMAFMLHAKHREFLPGDRPVCSSERFEMMRSMVQQGMVRGAIDRGDVMVVSSCLFGGAIRIITSQLDGILERPLDRCFDGIWTCSWRAVAAQ